jgi:hypothetical protein
MLTRCGQHPRWTEPRRPLGANVPRMTVMATPLHVHAMRGQSSPLQVRAMRL